MAADVERGAGAIGRSREIEGYRGRSREIEKIEEIDGSVKRRWAWGKINERARAIQRDIAIQGINEM